MRDPRDLKINLCVRAYARKTEKIQDEKNLGKVRAAERDRKR